MTKQYLYLGLLSLGLAACGSGTGSDASAMSGGNTSGTAKGTTAGKQAKSGGGGFFSRLASSHTLAAGTTIEVTLHDSLSSRWNKVGNPIDASVSRDVVDGKGNVVIPAGSRAAVHISAIAPSKAGDNSGEGVLQVTVTSVTVHGVTHNGDAVVRNVPHTMKGRGITKGEAEDVAVGTAVGAIAGQVIGKNTKGTVIGGAVGAVAGGAVAVAGAQRDIVVARGTQISFSLPASVTIAAR